MYLYIYIYVLTNLRSDVELSKMFQKKPNQSFSCSLTSNLSKNSALQTCTDCSKFL